MTLLNVISKEDRLVKEVAKWRNTHIHRYMYVYMYVNKIPTCKAKVNYFYLFIFPAGRH